MAEKGKKDPSIDRGERPDLSGLLEAIGAEIPVPRDFYARASQDSAPPLEKITPPAEYALTEEELAEGTAIIQAITEALRAGQDPHYFNCLSIIRDSLRNWLRAVSNYMSDPLPTVFSRRHGEHPDNPGMFIDRNDPNIALTAALISFSTDPLISRIETLVNTVSAKLAAFRAWEKTEEGRLWLASGDIEARVRAQLPTQNLSE